MSKKQKTNQYRNRYQRLLKNSQRTPAQEARFVELAARFAPPGTKNPETKNPASKKTVTEKTAKKPKKPSVKKTVTKKPLAKKS